MIKEKIADRLLNSTKGIGTDRSRCLRMRHNRNSCSECRSICRTGAIVIDEDIHIIPENCSECMLCTSACQADCFEIKGFDFYSLINRIKKISASVLSPVLSCTANADTACHEKTSCLGFLSEEHLIALSVFIDHTLQLDLTGCTDCRNGSVFDVLKKRIESIETKTFMMISRRIILVKKKEDLIFQEIGYDRRGFFKAIKNMTVMQAAGLFDNQAAGAVQQTYSSKKLPLKRDLLNKAIKILPEDEYRALLKGYYYLVTTTEDCNNCFACIGICPTGALKIESSEGRRDLFFSSSLCNGCGLCEGFCIKQAVRIIKGFPGGNPYNFGNTKEEMLCSV